MMHAETHRGLARRFADRIDCVRHGHTWTTTELALGELSLLRSECARCGRLGRVHRGRRHVETTSRSVA